MQSQRDPRYPNYRRPDFAQFYEPLWMKACDIYDELPTVEQKRRYLHQKPMEPDDAYRLRVELSVLDSRFKGAVNDNAALLTQYTIKDGSPVTLVGDDSRGIKSCLDDVDLQGHAMSVFLMACDIEAIKLDACIVLVEMQKRPDGYKGELRPYFVLVPITKVFAMKKALLPDGRAIATQFIVHRQKEQDEGDFGTVLLNEYARYAIADGVATVQLLTETKPGGTEFVATEPVTLVGADGKPLTELPMVWYSASGAPLFEPNAPPLWSLVELNAWHFTQSSELDNSISRVNNPTPIREWLNGDIPKTVPPLILGPNSTIEVAQGCKVYAFELSGAGHAITQSRLKDCEAKMERVARDFLGSGDNSGNKTATQASFEAVQSKASLKGLAENKESFVQQLFRWWQTYSDRTYRMGDYVGGIDIDDSVLNVPPSGDDVRAVLDSKEKRVLTVEEARAKLKEMGWAPEDFEPDDTEGLDAPTMPDVAPMVAQPVGVMMASSSDNSASDSAIED